MSGTLMLHAGGKPASFEEVCGVEIPAQTATYTPVGHGDLVRLVEDRAHRILGVRPVERSFGLARDGGQLFGLLKYPAVKQDARAGISIGLRNSYDGSLSIGIVLGACVFVCDNLALSGDSRIEVVRKHSGDVFEAVTRGATMALLDWEEKYLTFERDFEAMRARALTTREGYELLGVALGEGVLTPQLATVAFSEWRKPSFREWEGERNVFGAYQAVTHSLKQAAPARAISRYTGAHSLFAQAAGIADAEFRNVTGEDAIDAN